jgi:hypothetical protein
MTANHDSGGVQLLLFMNSDKCRVVRANPDVTVVWVTRALALNLATHIYAHLDEFPEVLPAAD